MSKFTQLIKYHFATYLKSNKFIMPLIAWLAFMSCFYMIIPVGVVSSCVISMACLFFIMVWMSMTYTELINEVSEQLMLLKVRNDNKYYLSKALFLTIIGAIMSCFGVLFPTLQNALNSFHLYTRAITIYDLLCAFILYLFTAALGAMIGTLFQPRIMWNRKMAIALTLGIALMGLVKVGINRDLPFSRYITWVFPPLGNMMILFNNKDFFYGADVVKVVGTASLYSIIMYFINLYLLKKNKF